MFISKYVHKYLIEQNERFKEIKINNQSLIYKKYIDMIEKDEELNIIWKNTINNLEEITKLAKEKYLKYKNKEKEYNREYCLNFYHTHPEYKEKQRILKRKQKENYNKLKEENEKLKNVINNINENILSVAVC